MTKDDVLRAIGKLSPEDREDIRRTLNMRHENDTGGGRLAAKLEREKKRLGPAG